YTCIGRRRFDRGAEEGVLWTPGTLPLAGSQPAGTGGFSHTFTGVGGNQKAQQWSCAGSYSSPARKECRRNQLFDIAQHCAKRRSTTPPPRRTSSCPKRTEGTAARGWSVEFSLCCAPRATAPGRAGC